VWVQCLYLHVDVLVVQWAHVDRDTELTAMQRLNFQLKGRMNQALKSAFLAVSSDFAELQG
jgi:hypothetical protein